MSARTLPSSVMSDAELLRGILYHVAACRREAVFFRGLLWHRRPHPMVEFWDKQASDWEARALVVLRQGAPKVR